MTKAFIDLNLDGRLKVITPYIPDFVDDLKNAIPNQYREWVKVAKAWLIDAHYLSDVEVICRKHFDEVKVDLKGFQTVSSIATDDLYGKLYLTSNAPMWLITKVWKLLAREYHPDVSGDNGEKMREINEIYQKIKEERDNVS